MAFNFKQPFQRVDLPKINYPSYKPNYRIIVASLLFLTAIVLLLSSCSEKKPDFFINSNNDSFNQSLNKSVVPPASVMPSNVPDETSFLSFFENEPKAKTENGFFKSEVKDQTYYTMDVGEYYLKNHFFADDRIKMDAKVAAFIKRPPTISDPGYYKRYHKVKSDFYKVRKYRKKLEKLEAKYYGRNHIISSLKSKRKMAFQIEAQLFYQLEKINYYADESYHQWQVFNSYDPKRLVYFETDAVVRSKQTATMFEDFSFALANYTEAH